MKKIRTRKLVFCYYIFTIVCTASVLSDMLYLLKREKYQKKSNEQIVASSKSIFKVVILHCEGKSYVFDVFFMIGEFFLFRCYMYFNCIF